MALCSVYPPCLSNCTLIFPQMILLYIFRCEHSYFQTLATHRQDIKIPQHCASQCDNNFFKLQSTFIWPFVLHTGGSYANMSWPLYGHTHIHTHGQLTAIHMYTSAHRYSHLPMCPHICTYIELSLYTSINSVTVVQKYYICFCFMFNGRLKLT